MASLSLIYVHLTAGRKRQLETPVSSRHTLSSCVVPCPSSLSEDPTVRKHGDHISFDNLQMICFVVASEYSNRGEPAGTHV